MTTLRELQQVLALPSVPCQIRCCSVGGCLSANGPAVKSELEKVVAAAGLCDRIEVKAVGCLGLCSRGPLVQAVSAEQVQTEGVLYDQVRPAQAKALVNGIRFRFFPGQPDIDAPELTAVTSPASEGSSSEGSSLEEAKIEPSAFQPGSHPFFTHQQRIVLENSGRVDPERIEDYVAVRGYEALYTVLREYSPEAVVKAITQSGLRGRGGAGYPTGLKWATVAKMPTGQKYVVCNADEGDPGAYMDRSVLESDPHRVLEGMAIAAYAVGANQGYIYVRGEYPLAINHLQTAIAQARRHGLLGSQIFDSPFDFRIDLRIGAGAFVCGEETALMASIEGKRGIPEQRPPYPAESGLWGCPTLINNVETYANIAPIIRQGPDWFASIGSERSKGTKVFSLTGKIQHAGLIEVPMGIPLAEIVETIGGGAAAQRTVKAVQTGGPSGGCIPAAAFTTPVDYESLQQLGSIMGSGGLIVMDDQTSMVDVARYFMEFCMEESCGKCIPCRAGTVQLYQLLSKFTQHRATTDDLQQLEALCDMVKYTSLCGLGQSAPNPVLSTLQYFKDEYLALVVDAA